MNVLSDIPLIPFLMLVLIVVLIPLFKVRRASPRFRKRRLLTDSEARVLNFLEIALPAHRIFAQVSMGALLEAAEADRKLARSTRNRFAQKIVDFVVVSRSTFDVVAIVELDDRTHRADRDARRDAMTAAAGYVTIRIPSRPQPTSASVRDAVAKIDSLSHAHH